MTTRTPTGRRARAALPAQPVSAEVLIEKYAKGDERSVDDVRRRVARALAAVEAPKQRAAWEARFLDAQRRGFVPAGRITSAAGTELSATLINCFVQPVGDSHHAGGRRRPRHLHRAGRGRRDHAPRRRRRLRLLVDPAQWRARGQHAEPRLRPGELHARVRPHRARRWNRPARGAARRWACCAATTRTSRPSSTPRTRAT